MNRNSYQTHSSGFRATSNNYKTSSSGFGYPTNQRAPLYPIGPTLPQPQFKPIQRGTSPYVSRQGMQPPSYEQRYHHQTSSGFQQTGGSMAGQRYNATKISFEERERDLIARNQGEIDQEHKRREQIRLSYERQIVTKTNLAARNLERKQRLLSQLDVLEATKSDLHSKLMDLRPPSNKINTYEPLDRKQQEMIIMKNKLINQMRQKEAQMHKEEEEEEKFWENQLAQKEKILLKLQLQLNSKRVELNSTKNAIEKPDLVSLQEEIRQQKYQDFIFEASEIESKINRLTQQRQKLTQQVRQGLTLKKPQMHSLRLRREELVREKEQIMLRVSDLNRIGRQMEEANINMLSELQRKDGMIQKYQNDIQELKDKKKIQESMMNQAFNQARESINNDLIPGLTREISSVLEELRIQTSTTTRLKTQYQRLYELLCSATTKNLHQSFSSVYTEIVS